MRKFFRIASRVIPSSLLVRGIKSSILSPFYHLISDSPPRHVKNLYPVLSIKEFEKDLDFLLKHFKPIDAKSLLIQLERGSKTTKHSMFLSFDDGFREIVDVISPILLKKGVPATFFINPAYVNNADLMYRCKISLIVDKLESFKHKKINNIEIASLLNVSDDWHSIKGKLYQLKYNQTDLINLIAAKIDLDYSEYLKSAKPYLELSELQDLAKLGFTIGGHGYNHPYFNELTYEQQLSEVETCMEWVKSNFHNQPKLFAFPFTDFGVSADLIRKMVLQPDSICDISFGTSGIQPIKYSKHLQRIPMECSTSGRNVIRGEILYYLSKKSIGYYKRFYDQNQ